MEKFRKYFLNACGLIAVLSACHPAEDKNELLATADKEERIKYYEEQLGRYYQGSVIRQEAFDQLIEIGPDKEMYLREKSVTHTKAGDYHIAFPLLEKAAEVDPSPALYYYSYLLLHYYHDYERALERLEQYDALTPNSTDYAWGESVIYHKGLAYRQLERYQEAIEQFDLYIEDEGKENASMYAYVYRGICYAAMNEHQKALQDFDQAISLYENSGMAHFYKSVSLYESGKNQEAKASILHARDLIAKGYKKEDPYKEIFDEVHVEMVDDKLEEWGI